MDEQIKDKIENKVEDIIYKKAKEEIEFTIKSYLKNIGKKIYSFMGWEETQEQKIDRLSKEIQDKKDVLLDDNVVGVVELFTMNYIGAMTTLMGMNIAEEPEVKKEQVLVAEPITENESKNNKEE